MVCKVLGFCVTSAALGNCGPRLLTSIIQSQLNDPLFPICMLQCTEAQLPCNLSIAWETLQKVATWSNALRDARIPDETARVRFQPCCALFVARLRPVYLDTRRNASRHSAKWASGLLLRDYSYRSDAGLPRPAPGEHRAAIKDYNNMLINEVSTEACASLPAMRLMLCSFI